jgi:hypothetical protein
VSNLLIIFIFFYENNEKYLIAYIILKSKKLGVARAKGCGLPPQWTKWDGRNPDKAP